MTLRDAALAYAQRGWAVFPVRPGGKAPATRHGFQDATTDIEVVAQWWDAHPDYNIGLPTGLAFDVLDIDGPAEYPEIVDPCLASTGHGWHYYFRPTGLGNRVRFASHMDWRGVGGYVVAPPSIHPDGHAYQWVEQHKLTEAPHWLRHLLVPPVAEVVREDRDYITVGNIPRVVSIIVEEIIGDLLRAKPGTRNNSLNTAAFRLGRLVGGHHLSLNDATDMLMSAAGHIGLSDAEAERTIESGMTAGLQQPKEIS